MWETITVAVRKHRAPKGALRRRWMSTAHHTTQNVRKHRAPKGALRRCSHDGYQVEHAGSESTERQKVH